LKKTPPIPRMRPRCSNLTGGFDFSGCGDCTSCPPLKQAEMSNSEPSAIVLQGIRCMCRLYKFRFEWRERFAQGSPRFTLSRSRMRSRTGLASPVENQACGIAKYPRLRVHRHEARMTPANGEGRSIQSTANRCADRAPGHPGNAVRIHPGFSVRLRRNPQTGWVPPIGSSMWWTIQSRQCRCGSGMYYGASGSLRPKVVVKVLMILPGKTEAALRGRNHAEDRLADSLRRWTGRRGIARW